MIYLYIFLAVVAAAATVLGVVELVHKRYKGMTNRKYRSLSWPAQRIAKMYSQIPADYRPEGDLYTILAAMDYKFDGKGKINDRCSYGGYYDSSSYSWMNFQGRRGYGDYERLYNSLRSVRDALIEQNQAVELGRRGDALDAAKRMMEDASSTSNIINQVTKEMTQ